MRISDWSSDVCSSDLTFFDALPFARKHRTHFHRFMLDVHERRKRYPDQRDPLKLVAEEYATEVRVLCFRSEEHTSELQSLMRISYAVFCLKKTKNHKPSPTLTIPPPFHITTYVG